MRKIDLNVDLGEGGAHDAELIALASSANIACGGHAGNDLTMRLAIQHCISRGVAIGAHPGYEDPEHFGRRELDLAPEEVTDMIARQLGRFSEIVAQAGAAIHHVKPHGALYNQADREPSLAAAIIAGVKQFPGICACYVPPFRCAGHGLSRGRDSDQSGGLRGPPIPRKRRTRSPQRARSGDR